MMFFSGTSFTTALVAMAFLSQASSSVAGRPRGISHNRRSLSAGHGNHVDLHAKRADCGVAEVTLGELQMLQSEYTAFKGWMTTGFNDASSIDAATYLAQLKQEFTAYDGWMSAWLDAALNAGSPSAPPAPSTSPLPVVSSVTAQIPPYSAGNIPTNPPLSTGGVIPPTGLPTGPPAGQPTIPPVVPVSSPAIPGPNGSSTLSTAVVASGSLSASLTPSTGPAPSGQPSAGGGSVAVYYGQSPATGSVPLSSICSDPSTDIVILAFLTTFFGPGGYPTLNFGPACGSAGSAAAAKGATGLLSCPDMAKDIQSCQSAGKKVLLSLGGSEAVTAFSSDSQASTFATQLTNLFTGGTGESADLRPFGALKLDGFDIDNEDHSTTYYSTFVSSLRSALNKDTSKTYYISAAPQCPRPDASIPLDAMQSMDFVFVQFYNNGVCDVGQPGFLDSFKAWSSDLSAKGAGPKLYIGAPACSACAGQGYVEPGAMATVIQSAKSAGVSNFGGVMLWDAAEAVQNGNYQKAMKSALG